MPDAVVAPTTQSLSSPAAERPNRTIASDMTEPDMVNPETSGLANPRVLWDAITRDTAGRVMILDTAGKVLYANDEADRRYRTREHHRVAGRTLTEMVGDLVGGEWIALVHRVAQTRRPLVVETTHKGARLRAVLRPLVYSELTFVLVVSRDVADLMPRDWGLDQGIEVVEPTNADMGPLSVMTQRESEILGLIGEGLSSAQIAEVLGRSVKTIEWHRHQIGQKLGVKSRIELANIALRAGLCRFERYPSHTQDVADPESKPEADTDAGGDRPASG